MVSVIIPVYNGERYIEACVQSVLTQSFKNLELLLVDDGSVDATLSLCRKLAEEDRRIRIFYQENAGVSAARNRGLEEARGEYVLFVDADDLLLSNSVLTLYTAARNDVDFVMGTHELFRGFQRENWGCAPRELTFPLTENAGEVQMLAGVVCGQMYRSSILREYNIRFPVGLPYGEDTVFNLQFFQFAQRGTVLEEVVYRRRKGGMASSLRFYPNRDEIALRLIQSYESCFSNPALLESVINMEVADTVAHYLIHCGAAETCEKIRPFLERIHSLYPGCHLPQTAKQAKRMAWKKKGKQILLRKLRKKICQIKERAGL